MTRTDRPDVGIVTGPAAVALGAATVAFSALYLVSDLIELAQGGYSTPQLLLTYAAEAAIPILVLGLWAVQRPRIGAIGLTGAVAYSYAFVFFTGTVLYALAAGVRNWTELGARLGGWMDVHGGLMIVAGALFGYAVVRARVLPAWTGVTLIVGMVLMVVTAALPAVAQTAAAGVRDVAFGAMGACLLVIVVRGPGHDTVDAGAAA